MSVGLRPFFSYYGAKFRDAPRYPAPQHAVLVEPFAGSAGYAVRHYERNVQLYDVDEKIVGVWRFLIAATRADILGIPAKIEHVDDVTTCEEARWLVGWWINKGCTQPRATPSAWMRSGVRPGSFWGERVRERIAWQVERIKHWCVTRLNYESIPNAPATWFIDPPYVDKGVHYKHGCSAIDFGVLGRWCRGRGGQVIVCEQRGATWLPFEQLHSAKTARDGRRSAEVVWTRFAATGAQSKDVSAPDGGAT